MPPPHAAPADHPVSAVAPGSDAPQTPEHIAAVVREFLARHPQAAVLEDGKVVCELGATRHTLATEHGRCTLQLWGEERNLVRTLVGATLRGSSLRLRTQRFGHTQPRLLELRADTQPRSPARREPARKRYLQLLERLLARDYPGWQPEAFRTAMDLERSFGPAYARGMLVRGSEAWAVIGVGAAESQAVIDGVLTLGILWLHGCRERAEGRRLFRGLRLVVPRGAGTLTRARLPWLNTAAAQWELLELDERTEELQELDPADQGNLRTRLMHLPDAVAARERFAPAIAAVLALVPTGQEHRVEQRLRSSAELAFLLHGLEFARARISLAANSFAHTLEITAGAGNAQTALTPATRAEIAAHIAELFARRSAAAVSSGRTLRPAGPSRSIGAFTGRAAHTRLAVSADATGAAATSRFALRERALAAGQDPLFRAAPERWLESVLRENLAPLTRSLAPPPHAATSAPGHFANDPDPDTRGNRADPAPPAAGRFDVGGAAAGIIPRFDPRFVYAQVPAIAGAGDRGLLDLLGITADGRLAVIELKASDDLQLALQGLDYWIRVRHHHREATDPATGLPGPPNDLQQHGYFRHVELSPLPPRLFLVAPALHIHPATETVLRYVSPAVEWTLLALDERWRQEVRVVWRRSGGRATPGNA